MAWVKAYKGFSKDMTCRGFQFEEGKTYELPEGVETKLCESGFHACENPLDCWNYYDITKSEYHEVELDEISDERERDTKLCARKIRIGAKLDLNGIVKASVDFVMNSVKGGMNGAMTDNGKYGAQIGSSGDWAQIGSSGDWAQIGSSGDWAQIGSSGDGARIGSSGDGAQIGSSGDWAQIGSSGDWAQIGSSGDGAQIGSSGDWARIGSSGDWTRIGSSGDGAQIGSSSNGAQIGSSGNGAQIGSSGNGAQIEMTGERSVAACVGNNGRIKAPIGCWIVLSEWKYVDGKWTPVCVRAAQVDGEAIKSDTWYKLQNGEFVECEGDDDE